MEVAPLYTANGVRIDFKWVEKIIFMLADEFHIRISWDTNAEVFTGVCALVGGVIGGYKGGKVGAAIGAGVGGVSGYTVSRFVTLRQVWVFIKPKVQELFYVILNYLNTLTPSDYHWAFRMLMSSAVSRRELGNKIVSFLIDKLERRVISSLPAA